MPISHSDIREPMATAATHQVPRDRPWFAWTCVVVAVLCTLYFYGPTLAEMLRQWSRESQYSHGFLVPLFSGYLLWRRREHLRQLQFQICVWGIPILILAGAIRFAGVYLFVDWLDAFSLLVLLAGLAVFFGGWPALRWSGSAIAFSVFMIPLPFRVQLALSAPLQGIATRASTYALQTLGFPALAEGNVILLQDVRMGIVEACSGLGMLFAFFALSTAVAMLLDRPLWEKIFLVASAVPIAIVANVVRITLTGMLHELAGRWLADLVFHDLAGWLMMPLGLSLLWLELAILSRVLIATPARTRVAPLTVATKSLTSGNATAKAVARLVPAGKPDA